MSLEDIRHRLSALLAQLDTVPTPMVHPSAEIEPLNMDKGTGADAVWHRCPQDEANTHASADTVYIAGETILLAQQYARQHDMSLDMKYHY